MHHKRVSLLVMAWLVAGGAQAAFLDGNQLLEYCTPRGGYGEGACDGYVAGVVDSRLSRQDKHGQPAAYCLPETVTLGQIVWLVTRYLHEHPQELHFTADSTVDTALQKAFPCAPQTAE